MPPDVAEPVAPSYPAVLVQYLRACLWRRMLIQHDGIASLMQWMFSGQKNPLTGERFSYGVPAEVLYPILLAAAEQWQAKRKST